MIILYFFLKYLFLLTNQTSPLAYFTTNYHTEAGTAQKFGQQSGPQQKWNSWKVTFKKAFTDSPIALAAVSGFSYTKAISGNQHQLQAWRGSDETTHPTYFDWDGYLNFIDLSKHHSLRVNYFVFSSNHPNIILDKHKYKDTDNVNQNFIVSTTKANQPQAYVGCFFRLIYMISSSSFKMHLNCEKYNSNSIKVIFSSSNVVVQQFNFWILIILSNTIMKAIHGSLISLISSKPSITYIPNANTQFFIGLLYWDVPSGKIYVDLENSNLKVHDNSILNKIVYQYFIIEYQRFVSLIQSQPFRNKVVFQFFSPNKIISTPQPAFDNFIQYDQLISETRLLTKLTSKINNDKMIAKFKVPGMNHLIEIQMKVITAIKIHHNVFQRILRVSIINIQSPLTIMNFNIINPRFLKILHQQTGTQSTLDIIYTNSASENQQLNIDIQDTQKLITSKIQLFISVISKIQTSAASTECILLLGNIQTPDTTTTLVTPRSPNIHNPTGRFISSNTLEIKFNYLPSIQTNQIVFGYILDISQFEFDFCLKIITVLQVNLDITTKVMRIILINIPNPQLVIETQFNIATNGPSLVSIQINNGKIVLITDATNYITDTTFDVTYTPQGRTFIVEIKDIKHNLVFNYMNPQRGLNSLSIHLENPEGITDPAQLDVQRSITELNLQQVIADSTITLVFNNNLRILREKLTLTLDSDATTLFKQSITIPFLDQRPLYYCAFGEDLMNQARIIAIISIFLNTLYLGTFIFAIISCQKLYALELIFIIQFTYSTFIPLNIYCPPFSGLEALKYITGVTPIFTQFQQKIVPFDYLSLGIYSNFLTNVNILLIPIFVCFLIYIPMRIRACFTKDKYLRPCLLKYGKTMLIDLPFTLLLFNTPSICISAVVNFQAFGITDSPSCIIAFVCLSMILLAALLFLQFKHHFNEFNKQFDIIDRSPLFNKLTTVKIRKNYPFILLCQMILVPTLLSIQSLLSIGLFLVLVLEIVITIIIFLVPLYLFPFDNIRSFIHRGIIISICLLQTVTFVFKHDHLQKNSPVFLSPFLLIALLIIGFICTGIYCLIMSVKHWISFNEMDISLQKGTKEKPLEFIPSKIYEKSSKKAHPIYFYLKKKCLQNYDLFETDYPPIQSVLVKKKLQKFFGQIEKYDLFNQLGVQKQTYEKFKKYAPDLKSNYIRRLFDNLTDITKKIQSVNIFYSLKDYLSEFDAYTIQGIRDINILRRRRDREYIQNKIPT